MQPRFVDLHTHTTASDGTDSPRELVRKAATAGLAAVAITDHDTLSGLAEAEAAGEAFGIDVIRGCELSVQSDYGEVHLLGLWLPKDASQLEQVLAGLRERRETRNRLIVAKLNTLGLFLTYDEVLEEAHGESVGRPHIAAVLLAKGYVGTFRQAFDLFLGARGAAYVPRITLDPEEGVRVLANLGGVVSFAHPMLIRCPPAWFDTIIPRLKEAGLSAIEAYHSEHAAKDERFCVDLAARYGLGLSGGSDYHGTTKAGVQLGRGKGGLRVTVALLDALKARRPSRAL